MSALRCTWIPLWLLLSAGAHGQVTKRTDEIGRLLNEWHASGTAAGLAAITYENRDDSHSLLPQALWPGLKFHAFSEQEKAAGRAKGPAQSLRSGPVIGNCSMAASADRGGSLARLFFMQPEGNRFLTAQYIGNQLFLYPEHQDHDPGGNGAGGWGDLFPLNHPGVLIPQGSSGSDQPFLSALLATLAALPPDTQKKLIELRLLMPALQFLLRRHNAVVSSDEEYLSGRAHPVVFDRSFLDEKKMVLAANAMTPGAIPPLALIEILEETAFEPNTHFFETPAMAAHKLADTPVACARVYRGLQPEYRFVISAAKSLDVMKRPLKLRVALLQGDPAQVKLEYDPEKPLARVTLRWQSPTQTTRPESRVRSHRVDIGFFVDNGVSLSPPAILSVLMLPNERRFYDPQGRITEIHYAARNPDLGLPAEDTDPRWLRVLSACVRSPAGLPSTLMARALETAEQDEIHVTLNEWETLQQHAELLEKDPQRKDEAKAARQQFQAKLAARLQARLPGTRALTLRATVETALLAIAKFTDLYPGYQTEIQLLAEGSPVAGAAAELRAEVNHLLDLGLLRREPDGRVLPLHEAQDRSEAENEALRSLNLTVLSHALYPGALVRKAGAAWVDPRLSTIKRWRDVHQYDASSGQLTGWLRYQGGSTQWFDAQGRWFPEGPGPDGKAVEVVYAHDPDLGLQALPRP